MKTNIHQMLQEFYAIENSLKETAYNVFCKILIIHFLNCIKKQFPRKTAIKHLPNAIILLENANCYSKDSEQACSGCCNSFVEYIF